MTFFFANILFVIIYTTSAVAQHRLRPNKLNWTHKYTKSQMLGKYEAGNPLPNLRPAGFGSTNHRLQNWLRRTGTTEQGKSDLQGSRLSRSQKSPLIAIFLHPAQKLSNSTNYHKSELFTGHFCAFNLVCMECIALYWT